MISGTRRLTGIQWRRLTVKKQQDYPELRQNWQNLSSGKTHEKIAPLT
jgi:hypothetical protein